MSDTALPGGNSAATPAGPTTFAEAFAAEPSPSSDPGSETASATTAEQSAAPSAVPGTTDDDRSPYIPRARFDEINTKLKEMRDWRESRTWAEHVDPQAFRTMSDWFVRAQRDPQAFAVGLLDELAQHPQYAAQIRSELARRLGTRSGQQAPASEDGPPDPDVEIVDANGRVTGRTYSDQQLAKRDAYLRKQMLAEVDAKYAPHVQTLDQIRQERERLTLAVQADAFGKSFVGELSALPLFEAHKADIAKTLQGMQLDSDHPDAVRAAAYRAYHQVVGPKLLDGGKSSAVADLQRKAHAATAVSPSASASSAPRTPTSFHDAALQW
jgi:hypothetical protein